MVGRNTDMGEVGYGGIEGFGIEDRI